MEQVSPEKMMLFLEYPQYTLCPDTQSRGSHSPGSCFTMHGKNVSQGKEQQWEVLLELPDHQEASRKSCSSPQEVSCEGSIETSLHRLVLHAENLIGIYEFLKLLWVHRRQCISFDTEVKIWSLWGTCCPERDLRGKQNHTSLPWVI